MYFPNQRALLAATFPEIDEVSLLGPEPPAGPEARLDAVVNAIAAAVGIDTLVWLTDIAGRSREEAVDVMRWSARALLQAALTGPGGRATVESSPHR